MDDICYGRNRHPQLTERITPARPGLTGVSLPPQEKLGVATAAQQRPQRVDMEVLWLPRRSIAIPRIMIFMCVCPVVR
jgi:hypothetical protein